MHSDDNNEQETTAKKEKVGLKLRQAREAKNIPIADVTETLKMRPRLVTALEESAVAAKSVGADRAGGRLTQLSILA